MIHACVDAAGWLALLAFSLLSSPTLLCARTLPTQGIARVEREGYDILKVGKISESLRFQRVFRFCLFYFIAFHVGPSRNLTMVNVSTHAREQELGADPLRQVFTAGGGSENAVWTEMRARILGVREGGDRLFRVFPVSSTSINQSMADARC